VLFRSAVLEKLGTGAVFVWDQYLGSGPDVPQLAIMIRADEAADVRDGLAETVQIVVDWLDLQDRGASGQPIRFSQSEYLGQTVYELELPATVWGAFSDRNGGLLFRPAFTSMDDWLIVATGADQIRNMIDAHWGLTPTLHILFTRPRMERIDRRLGYLSALPLVVLLALSFLAPMLVIALFSVMPQKVFSVLNMPDFSSFAVIIEQGYYKSLLWSLGMAAVSTFVLFLVSWPLAYGMAKVFNRFTLVITVAVVMTLFVSENIRLFGWVLTLMKGGLIEGHKIGRASCRERV